MRTRARAAAALLLCVALAGLRSAGCAEDAAGGGDAQSLPAWHPRRFSHRRAPRARHAAAARVRRCG
jgi:hypothetical protein